MNITKRDVLELRRRLTKKACSFDELSGCYVGGSGEILLRFHQSFPELEDDEYYKYLDIAKKALSGSLGVNLLELGFDRTEAAAERQKFLLAVRSSKLKNEELLDRFYEQVMASYDKPGNYLILVFHDIYDVIARASDRAGLDESEEVYEYMICAVCPVELSKAGLGYREEENRIGPRERDWVVSMPEIGFLYPAFANHGSDTNAVMYYVRNGGDTHEEFVTEMLGCVPQRTAAEQKKVFQSIVQEAFGSNERQADAAYLTIQRNLDGLVSIEEDEGAAAERELTLTAIADVMADVDMPEETRAQIEKKYAEAFGEQLPCARHLLDSKLAAEGAQRAQTMQLQKKITDLQERLEQSAQPRAEEPADAGTVDVHLPEERRGDVHTQVMDGRKYLLIPLGEGETARVNGSVVEE